MNHDQMQECTAHLANTMNKALCLLLDHLDEPVEKCAAIMTVAFSLNTVLAMHLGGPDRFNDASRKLPNRDEQLLASLLVSQAGEITPTGEKAEFDGHEGAFARAAIEFNPLNILAALDQFKTLTGRDGHELLDPGLWAAVQRYSKVDPDGFGPLGKQFFTKR